METEVAVVKALAGADLSSTSGILLLLVFVILPAIWKIWNWSKETSAQGALYSQLSEMVQNQRKELDKLYENRMKDQEQIFELRRRVDNLAGYEQQVEVLKKKLDQKDQIIAERDKKIAELLNELLGMKDRVHSMELRLKDDEVKWKEVEQNKNIQHAPPALHNEN